MAITAIFSLVHDRASIWNYRLGRLLPDWEFTPTRIAIVYLFFAFLGLFVSDVVLVLLVQDADLLAQLQAFKGGTEIVLTAGLIFVLTRRSRRTLEERNRRLRQTREELQVLHRVLRHNLRNKINVITGYARLVAKDTPDDELTDWCDQISLESHEIIHYVEQTRTIDSLSERSDRQSVVDVTDQLREVLDDYQGSDVTITTEMPESATVRTHPDVTVAFEEVIDNAIVHNDADDAEVDVTVTRADGRPHEIAVRIADNGPGIPEVERRALAHREESGLVHSDGMGLWIATWVVTLSNGAVEIEETDPRGSEVTMWLPRA